MSRYTALRTKGLCVHCPNFARLGKVNCQDCAEKNNKRSLVRRSARKKNRICQRCPSAVEIGKVLCRNCGLKSRFKLLDMSEEEKTVAQAAIENFQGVCENQGCATVSSGKQDWHIDHDHKTKKFRGILCGRCNHLLGQARDSVKILLGAIQYLQKNSQEVKIES